jgi:hypothetical protein
VLLAGCAGDAEEGPGAPAAKPTVGTAPEFESYQDVPTRRSAPTRLRIPSLQVDAPVGPVGKAPDGSVEVPQRWEEVGWYDGGARPGEQGPAVLPRARRLEAGPAVFVRLPQVQVGPSLSAGRRGRRHRFAVDRVEQHPKTGSRPRRLPARAAAGAAAGHLRWRLRPATGHYVDNIVVYASPVA